MFYKTSKIKYVFKKLLYSKRNIEALPITHPLRHTLSITSYLTQPYPLRHILRNPIHYVISYATLPSLRIPIQPDQTLRRPVRPYAKKHRQNITQTHANPYEALHSID